MKISPHPKIEPGLTLMSGVQTGRVCNWGTTFPGSQPPCPNVLSTTARRVRSQTVRTPPGPVFCVNHLPPFTVTLFYSPFVPTGRARHMNFMPPSGHI
jgi:hypothetical protein